MATGRIRHTPETTNFAKLSACIIGPCTRMLRELLLKHVQPIGLRALVQAKLDVRRDLNYVQRNKLMTGPIPDYKIFDITFLYLLLRTPSICTATPNITAPTNGWGRPPKSPTETTIGDDMERIRSIKNDICSHGGTPELDLPVFNHRVSEIKDIARRFDMLLTPIDCFVTEIHDRLNEPLDREAAELYINRIEELNNQDKDTRQELTKLQGQIERQSKELGSITSELITVKSELLKVKSKLKDQDKRDKLIEKSRKKIENKGIDQKVKISAYKTVISKLATDGFAVVTGIPGDGKTTLGFCVMYDIMNDKVDEIKGKQPLIITKPSQWENIVNPSEDLVIFVDDMFGIEDLTNFGEWKHIVGEIEDVCTDTNDPRRNFVIIALRVDVLNGCPVSLRNHKIFQSACNLRDQKNFTKEEKLELLKKVNPAKPFTDEEREKIIERTKHLGFPQCCHLFSNDPNLKKRGIEFFYEPVIFLKLQLRDLWDFEETKFSVLGLMMLNGGQMPKQDFCKPEYISKIANFCRKGTTDKTMASYLNAAQSLDGTYLTHDDETFQFLHDSVQHAIATVLWEYNSSEVINQCSFQFLSNVCTSATQSSGKDTLIVQRSCFKTLTNRIVAELSLTKSHTYKTVANMKIWGDGDICTMVNTVVSTEHTGQLDLSRTDEDSKSLLYHAIGAGNIPLVKYLYTHSPTDPQCYDAVKRACEIGDLEVFKTCQEHYSQTTLEMLFSAVTRGNNIIFKELTKTNIDFYGKHPSTQLQNINTTLLQEICSHGKLGLLKISIENISKEMFLSIAKEQELLHFAAIGGSVSMLKYLIESGMNVYQKEKQQENSILHISCSNGNLAAVKYLFEISDLLEMKNKYNQTPLHYIGLGTGSVDVATYLIDKCVDIHAKDRNGAMVFQRACFSGNLNLLKFLHEKDFTMVILLDKYNRTSLHYVGLGTGSVDVAAYLIDKCVDIRAKDINGATVFQVACYSGNSNLLKYLHEKDSTLVTSLNKYNMTSLHYVGEGTGSVDVATYLIDKCVDIRAKDIDEATVFQLACFSGNLKLLKYLHEKDSTLVTLLDKNKWTSLHYVGAGTGCEVVATFLIDKCVGICAKDVNGATVFQRACFSGNLNLLKFLHEKDSTLVTLLDKYNKTSLNYVGEGTGSVNVATYLIDKCVDIRSKDINGATVFQWACKSGNLNLLKYLHEKDSTLVTLLDKDNWTSLHYTGYGTGSVEVASFLISNGVNVKLRNKQGKSALDKANKNGNKDLVNYIKDIYN